MIFVFIKEVLFTYSTSEEAFNDIHVHLRNADRSAFVVAGFSEPTETAKDAEVFYTLFLLQTIKPSSLTLIPDLRAATFVDERLFILVPCVREHRHADAGDQPEATAADLYTSLSTTSTTTNPISPTINSPSTSLSTTSTSTNPISPTNNRKKTTKGKKKRITTSPTSLSSSLSSSAPPVSVIEHTADTIKDNTRANASSAPAVFANKEPAHGNALDKEPAHGNASDKEPAHGNASDNESCLSSADATDEELDDGDLGFLEPPASYDIPLEEELDNDDASDYEFDAPQDEPFSSQVEVADDQSPEDISRRALLDGFKKLLDMSLKPINQRLGSLERRMGRLEENQATLFEQVIQQQIKDRAATMWTITFPQASLPSSRSFDFNTDGKAFRRLWYTLNKKYRVSWSETGLGHMLKPRAIEVDLLMYGHYAGHQHRKFKPSPVSSMDALEVVVGKSGKPLNLSRWVSASHSSAVNKVLLTESSAVNTVVVTEATLSVVAYNRELHVLAATNRGTPGGILLKKLAQLERQLLFLMCRHDLKQDQLRACLAVSKRSVSPMTTVPQAIIMQKNNFPILYHLVQNQKFMVHC